MCIRGRKYGIILNKTPRFREISKFLPFLKKIKTRHKYNNNNNHHHQQ